jgi:hypothetical protein
MSATGSFSAIVTRHIRFNLNVWNDLNGWNSSNCSSSSGRSDQYATKLTSEEALMGRVKSLDEIKR